jgi:hypothetical protein
MDTWWAKTNAREVARKNSQGALLDLFTIYESLDQEERVLANQVLSEWIASTDDSKRFDALAMVDHFSIRSAINSLRSLAAAIQKREDHEAPYELAKVKRILDRLEG